jgi:hypothetical protein
MYSGQLSAFKKSLNYPKRLIRSGKSENRQYSNLDLHLEFDSEEQIKTKLYNKRDDFNFPIVNFPFICSNSPAAPVYGVKLYLSVDMTSP